MYNLLRVNTHDWRLDYVEFLSDLLKEKEKV